MKLATFHSMGELREINKKVNGFLELVCDVLSTCFKSSGTENLKWPVARPNSLAWDPDAFDGEMHIPAAAGETCCKTPCRYAIWVHGSKL